MGGLSNEELNITAEDTKLLGLIRTMGLKPDISSPEAFTESMNFELEHRVSSGRVAHDTSVRRKSNNMPVNSNEHVTLTPSPRISLYSGIVKGDYVGYDQWRFEVTNLMNDTLYAREVTAAAVRRSLRGDASKVVIRLGVNSSLETLLAKLDGIYGQIEDSGNILATFYSAEQKVGETVAEWGCRLEDLLSKVDGFKDSSTETNSMLRSKFWSGLLPSLKDTSRHKYDVTLDFDALRTELRKIEAELGQRKRCNSKDIVQSMAQVPKPINDTHSSNDSSHSPHHPSVNSELLSINSLSTLVSDLATTVKDMRSEIGELKGQITGMQGGPSFANYTRGNSGSARARGRGRGFLPNGPPPPFCGRCGYRGHTEDRCEALIMPNTYPQTRLN